MKSSTSIVAVALLGAFVAGADSSAGERTALPGRQVKVAAIAIGFGGNHEKKLRLGIEHLETAGQQGVDIACLPEEFSGTTAETIPGPTVNAVAELARKHRMYVVCPIREQAADGQQYNTAVLLDRTGKVQGRYRKVFVYWGEGLNPSRDGVSVFDTDFGRIAILTCFDANFDEVWQGIFEGLLFGLFLALVFTIVVGCVSKARCSYGFGVVVLLFVAVAALVCWAVGGLLGMGLAVLGPEFYRHAFIGVPQDFGEMLRYAWVGGSIWGIEFGGFALTVLGSFLFYARWRQRARPTGGNHE